MPDPSLIIHFETLGCRLNQDETEGAARCFSQNGFTADLEGVTASTKENLDVVLCIVNTCTVTGKAEQKARRIIRLLLEKYPSSIVLVTGCYAELDGNKIQDINPNRIAILRGTKKYLLSRIACEMSTKNLFDNERLSLKKLQDFVVENSLDDKIFAPVDGTKLSALGHGKVLSGKDDLFSLFTPVFEKHSRGSIKVQDGCNCSCSFCRIHFARGKSVSLFANEVIRRVKEMEKSGINEVVFTGVNLSQYSSEDSFGNSVDFSDLLSMVLEHTKKIRIRISSLYPQSVDEKMCQVLKHERIQPFFHLSIQSGSPKILREMNRPHSVESVEKSIELIRRAKENPFISCDIIAGFPGESEEDFELTKKLCQSSNFSWIHAFPYSPRPGTSAATMKNQIPERVKGDRVKWLNQKAMEGKISYVESCVGKTFSAIVENSRALRNSGNTKVVHAVTDNYLHVECPVEDSGLYSSGTVVKIKIKSPCAESIKGGQEIECLGELLD